MAVLMRRLFIAMVALAAASAPAHALSLTGVQVGEIFCAGRLSDDMAPVEAILTPELKAAIAEAEAKNAEIEKAEPGDKPPLGDGIPWQTAPDYAPRCSVVGMSGTAEHPQVVLFYQFPDQPTANWSDRLELTFVDERLRINDVIYSDGSRLTQALVDAFKM